MTINNSTPLTSNIPVVPPQDPTSESIFKSELESMYQEIFSKYLIPLDESEESNPIKRKRPEENSEENGSSKFPYIVEADQNFFNSTPLEGLYPFEDSIDNETMEGLETLNNALQNNEIHPTPTLAPEENRSKESISLATTSSSNLSWNMLPDSEKLQLPRLAWEKVMESKIGLSQKEIIRYLPENNHIEIQDGKHTFVFNGSTKFPKYYRPPEPYSWSSGGSRRSTNIYTIGIMLRKIVQITNLKDQNLDSLINDMMNPIPGKNTKTCSLERLIQIQLKKLPSNSVQLEQRKPKEADPQTKVVINLETQETPSNQKKNNITELQYQPFLDACPKLKLSQIVEFSIAVLEEIKKEPNGLIEQYLRPFLPENSFVKIANGKIAFSFGIKKDVVDSKYLPKEKRSTGSFPLRSNMYTVGKILETTLQGSITPKLQQLIDDMTNALPHARGTLISNLTDLKKIHKELIKQEN